MTRDEAQAALVDYIAHQSWRCDYRTRYGECCCGLDEVTAALGIDPVPPDDPESPEALAHRASLASPEAREGGATGSTSAVRGPLPLPAPRCGR